MTERLAFDGAHLRATLAPVPDARGLMVTFDFRKPGKSDFAPTAASSNFRRAGFAQLSIKTRANDWFVNGDTAALDAALPGIVAGYPVVRCLGYSMGGYGAFRFARALGAVSVVAVSPQVSIDRDVVPFDRRYRREAAGFDPVAGVIAGRSDMAGLILLDPFVTADLRHAQMLLALFPRLTFARLGFGGHPSIRLLREAGRGWQVHKAATAQVPDGAAILRDHRAARSTSQGYWTRLAERAAPRRLALTATARARAAACHATGPGNGSPLDDPAESA